ncbi:hypothetical protein Dda_9114 [Drechslerella dactyloides]|uniref:Transcription initiation factor TFIID subunit 4 n=1 Tax=Drechslerella dactyloides TaxID=74499 RepID=A0AAD6IPS5_DREDA|nr:hypothetical protein Dda_9114 [Drechslerella dactyloides]
MSGQPVQMVPSAASPPSSSPMQMPPMKRARLEPTSATNSPGPGTPTPLQSAAAAAAMSMPPPSSTSPIQKPVDTRDLSDVLFSTGVDLHAEEQFLYNDTPAASFNAFLPAGGERGGVSLEQRQINREDAETSGKARHWLEPFLNTQSLQARINDRLVAERLFSHGEAISFSELVSIAAQERVRELLTTAYVYANHRRQGNTLRAMGDWTDIAMGESEGRNGRLSDVQEGEAAASPGGTLSRKRSFAVANASSQTARTPALLSESARSLRQIATDERMIEEARIAARLQRLNGTKPGTPAATDAVSADTPNPPPGSVAPEPEKRMTAKEAKRAQNSRLDEIQSHKAANETASLMLGGGRKKKYSWMSAAAAPAGGGGGGGGSGSGASTPTRMPGTPGATTGKASGASGSAAAGTNGPVMHWKRRMGEWNEQGERGKGIQLRDWAMALEADGREKKTAQKGFLKMK